MFSCKSIIQCPECSKILEVLDFIQVLDLCYFSTEAANDINLFAIQAHHQVTATTKPAYDAFRTQVEDLMREVAVKRSPDGTSSLTAIVSKGKEPQ